MSFILIYIQNVFNAFLRGCCGRDHMVVEFTTTCAISAYHHWSCEFESLSWQGVLNIILCNKVCQWLVADRWFSLGTPVSSTIKTDCHYITEILLKVALNTINFNPAWNGILYKQPLLESQMSEIFINLTCINQTCLFWTQQLVPSRSFLDQLCWNLLSQTQIVFEVFLHNLHIILWFKIFFLNFDLNTNLNLNMTNYYIIIVFLTSRFQDCV